MQNTSRVSRPLFNRIRIVTARYRHFHRSSASHRYSVATYLSLHVRRNFLYSTSSQLSHQVSQLDHEVLVAEKASAVSPLPQKGSGATTVVNHAELELKRPSALWK